MTRRSRREVERALEDLAGDVNANAEAPIEVLYRDGAGELVDENGDPATPDPEVDQTVVIERGLAMPREQAEAEGREILGSVEGAPEDCDVVRVARREQPG